MRAKEPRFRFRWNEAEERKKAEEKEQARLLAWNNANIGEAYKWPLAGRMYAVAWDYRHWAGSGDDSPRHIDQEVRKDLLRRARKLEQYYILPQYLPKLPGRRPRLVAVRRALERKILEPKKTYREIAERYGIPNKSGDLGRRIRRLKELLKREQIEIPIRSEYLLPEEVLNDASGYN